MGRIATSKNGPSCDCLVGFSVKHKYDGEWTDKTRLSTCDAHAKRMVTSSDPPQEVENKQEIIFTYDVDFQVSLRLRISHP